jgi:hypothetical protein
MSFSVPNIVPFTLPAIPPASVITSTLNGLTPPVPDAAFLNNVLSIANTSSTPIKVTDGLFTNPLFSHMQVVDSAIASLKPLSTLASAADALPGAPGGAVTALTTVISHMKDLTTMFSNMATNIVPVQLTMNPLISSAIGSMPSIGNQSAEAMKVVPSFIQNMGVPSMGTVLNQASSEFSLNQLCGTVDPTNPSPMLGNYSTMLSSMASTAMNFLKTVEGGISSVLTSVVDGFHSAITGLLSTVEGAITSFAAPIASFGSSMFNSIKNQMATGTATLLRHMSETNPTLAFNLTGSTTNASSALSSLTGSSVASATSSATSSVSSVSSTITGIASSTTSGASSALSGITGASSAVSSVTSGVSGALGSFAGLVTPNLASTMTKFPSPAAQAQTSMAPYSMPDTTAITNTSGPPDFTTQQVQLLQQAQSYVENAIKQQQADLDAAVASATAWKTSVNYTTVKNAQNDSPTAQAAYLALKAQAAARQDFMTGRLLLVILPYNQGIARQFQLIQNIGATGLAATATNGVSGTFPTDNVVLYGGTQTAGSYTTTKYIDWTIAATLIAAGNSYTPVQL